MPGQMKGAMSCPAPHPGMVPSHWSKAEMIGRASVRRKIWVIDGDADHLGTLVPVLAEYYQVQTAMDGKQALEQIRLEPPDLILLAVRMPGLDGHSVCRRLKADELTQHIPVIFINNLSTSQVETVSLGLGAVDYLTRPVQPTVLLSRVHSHLTQALTARSLRMHNQVLECEIAKHSHQITAMQDVTILAMASLSETRDTDTANHLRRTQNYVRLLATYMRDQPGYAEYLRGDMVNILYRCAPLHDIGKVGIPDRILLKAGRYTPDEYELMKRHTTLGRDALARVQSLGDSAVQLLAEPADFFETAKELVYSHHEKWDGSGYPQGLKGNAIPISARLMSIADVYDALISPRVYKAPMAHAKAQHLIEQGRGTFFAPEIVDAFVALAEEFQAVAWRYADSQNELAQKTDFANSALETIVAM